MNATIRNGDSLELLKDIPAGSVDCLITDPPYGISFMNKDWDKAVPDIAIWKECLRVMKPGAFAFVMCSPRSDVQAEMVIKLKEAGFEVGFSPIYWTFSQGFPKAMNISKAVDRKIRDSAMKVLYNFVYDEVFRSLGIPQGLYARLVDLEDIAIGEVGFDPVAVGEKPYTVPRSDNGISANSYGLSGGLHRDKPADRVILKETIPATEEAKRLDGSYAGFQPKPAVEVILVAMKPLSKKTYVDQALKNGKGITWLDDGRIPYQSDQDRAEIYRVNANGYGQKGYNLSHFAGREQRYDFDVNSNGRFPANLLVQDNVLDIGAEFKSPSGYVNRKPRNEVTTFNSKNSGFKAENSHGSGYGDSGDLSRYFSIDAWYEKNVESLPDYVQKIFPFLYAPKPGESERDMGLNTRECLTVNDGREKSIDNPFQRGETLRRNVHPTVKPIKLMTYLITIGSRPGDTILDPFLGSGTTGVAAAILNRDFIGFEIDGVYFEIAEERIKAKQPITIESFFSEGDA